MLFDTISESTVTNWDDVEPSKYEANLEGALMLVYENECNYNALMRAAGLSELKYFKETGEDLFVHEAGAFGGFLAKAKAFFKAVLDKIKALFKKFFMTISSFVSTDKEWVKKYEKDILRATNIKDMEFKGYKFGDLDGFAGFAKVATEYAKQEKLLDAIKLGIANSVPSDYAKLEDDDAVQDVIEANRGRLVGESSADESEFRDKLKEAFYGDTAKEVLDDSDINLRQQLQFIRDTKESTKSAQKAEKYITNAIDKIIKAVDKKTKEFGKVTDDEKPDTDAAKAISKSKEDAIKACNQGIKVLRSLSNDATVMSGMLCQALKDRNRQAKAICIKAVSYNSKKKNESAVYSDTDDLFAGVTIR